MIAGAGCTSDFRSGPWQTTPGGIICLSLETYPEISMAIVIFELPPNTTIRITGIRPLEPTNLTVHDEYRMVGPFDHLVMSAGSYPPISPFREQWDTAKSPFGVPISASDLPLNVVAHVTPSGAGDASLAGFEVSYTSGHLDYKVTTTTRLEVAADGCN